jgi:hypothetical protein
MTKILTFGNDETKNGLRNMTADELAQHETDKADSAQRKADRVAKEIAKREIYVKLGLSDDEIDLLMPRASEIDRTKVL